MKAGDIMTSPAVTIGPDATLRQVAAVLGEHHISGVPVVEGDRLVGIVSEADLLRRRAAAGGGRRVRDVMTQEVVSVAPDAPVTEVAALLGGYGFRRVPVLEGGRVVGIVSRSNLVQALAVRPPSGKASSGDEAVRDALLERLEREPWWGVDSNLIVADGIVHFWGARHGGEPPGAAEAAARAVPGVRGVEDHRFSRSEATPAPARWSVRLRRAAERGHSKHGWVEAWHSFSFGNYYDPAHMGYGPLHAINEKLIQPSKGSTTYGLCDVEVLTYVLEGAVGHEDSLDNQAVLVPGDVQCVSAGSGVRFSESNAAEGELTRFFQIWIDSRQRALPAAYESRRFRAAAKRGRLALVASPHGSADSLRLRADVCLYAGCFDGEEHASFELAAGRLAYLQLARGALCANGLALSAGDGLAVRGPAAVRLEKGRDAEALLFDLPGSVD